MADEPTELVQFREAWRAEVQRKKATQDHSDTAVAAKTHLPDELPSSLGSNGVIHSEASKSVPNGAQSAVDLYRQAVQYEQTSQLDDALRLYRLAFRMDPHVDKVFHRLERLAAMSIGVTSPTATAPVTFDELPQRNGSPVVPKASVVAGTLVSLLETFPRNLVFQPEDEAQPCSISILPDELLVLILRKMGPSAIERFARVSRKARVITLDSAIWKEIVEIIYKPPQIAPSIGVESIAELYKRDSRRTFIEHPRVRVDGVYIAVCHYVRQGLSENAWVNISHLITYHRYLRFLSNGQVLSLLANEKGLDPKEVVPLLQPNSSMKGMFRGRWELRGTSVLIRDLLDSAYLPSPPSNGVVVGHNNTSLSTTPAAHQHQHPHLHSHHHHTQPSTTTPRYNFQMTLHLRSRPLGRWNKLEWEAYESVEIDSGEVCELSLKNERGFWFSRVKSWGW